MLSIEMRELLLNGPNKPPAHQYNLLRYGGTATVRAAWHRHRQELLDACEPGRRAFGACGR